MNPILLQKQTALATKRKELQGFLAKFDNSSPTSSDKDALKKFNDEIAVLVEEVNTFQDFSTAAEANAAALKGMRVPQNGEVPPVDGASDDPVYRGHLKNFKGADGPKEAYRFGMWLKATYGGDQDAVNFCATKGIAVKTMTGGLNSSLGALIPEEFIPRLIVLRETYGVARRLLEIVEMKSETAKEPRRVGGLTAYMLGSSGLTESEMQFDDVELTAKEIGVLAKYKNAAAADSIINLGDRFMGEMAYAFTFYEDDKVFNGDGSGAYDKFLGIRAKLTSLSNTIAYIAGLTVGSGNAYSELTLTDFDKTLANLPQYADTPATCWVMHKTFFHSVCVPLLTNLGGVTFAEGQAGARTPLFRGYPVIFSQVMPKAEANSQVCALFGDHSLGGMLGDRNAVSITPNAMSDSAFQNNETWLRAIERIDINIHDVGNANATASKRQAGPIVGLITAAA